MGAQDFGHLLPHGSANLANSHRIFYNSISKFTKFAKFGGSGLTSKFPGQPSPPLSAINSPPTVQFPYRFINAKHQVRSRWRRSRWQNMFAHFIYN